ncbi:MAG: SMC-Scp complex subunit ScpB [Chitinophagaceae bacterium]|nr:MAG: SMC-Scp complex subunit ScpB [Chitinophagaceae bacterium]
MEITSLIPHIESLIFASDKPLTSLDVTELLNNAFGFMEDKITLDQVEASLEGIQEKYQSEFYPFEVRQSGGGWQFLTKKDYHKTIAQLNGDKFLKRLSAAAMETLSIVAYKQPVTKGEIEAIRGVSSDYAVQKLLEKELIVISGRNETMPGHPLIYSTSKNFMDYFGINTAEDLPKIKEVLADQQVEPTSMKDGLQTGEAGNAPADGMEAVPEEALAGNGPEQADGIEVVAGTDADSVEDADIVTADEAGNEEAEATPAGELQQDDESVTAESDELVTAESDELVAAESEEPVAAESDESDADGESEETDDTADAPATDEDTPAEDDELYVGEDGQLIGRMEEDDEEQS